MPWRLIIGLLFATLCSLLPLTLHAVSVPAATKDWVTIYGSIDPTDADSLKAQIKKGGPLLTWFECKLAELYLSSGKPQQALKHIEQAEQDPGMMFWKAVLKGRAHLALKQSRKALQSLAQLPPPPTEYQNNPGFYRALYGMALDTKVRALNGRGLEAQGLANLKWALYPDDYDPLTYPVRAEPKIEHRILRARTLSGMGRDLEIPEILQLGQLRDQGLAPTQRCEGLNTLAKGLRVSARTQDALAAYNTILDHQCEEDITTSTYYWKAQLLARLKSFAEAITVHEAFVKKYPEHRYTDDAYYSLWQLHTDLKQESKAKQALHKLMELTQGDMKAKQLWEGAYAAFKKKNYQAAISDLEKILSLKDLGQETHPQAHYWMARSLEEKDRKKPDQLNEHALSVYQLLMKNYPFSFYAVLAAHRLNTPYIPPSFATPRSEKVDDPLLQSLLEIMNPLNQSHLNIEAQNLLDYFSQLHPELVERHKPLLAQKWQESGQYHRALSMATEVLGTNAFAVNLDPSHPLTVVLYPIAFHEDMQRGVGLSGLPQSIIQGIMREESLFRPIVASVAGAQGVMQLMPSTAKIQAKKINLEGFSVEQLSNPQTNIVLGATFFSDLLKKFNGNIPLSVMGYNAGPGNVRKWLKEKGHLPLDEFIEECPFGETRGYVKRVLRSIQVYGSRLNEQSFTQPFFSLQLPRL